MSPLTRRMMLLAAGALPFLPVIGRLEAAALPAVAKTGGMALKDALMLRRSTRAYSDRKVSIDTIANLLWAANGINRPESGGRTAPVWRSSYEVDILVAASDGVRRYDSATGSLEAVLEADLRAKASPQPFVATAPLVLIYVADLSRMATAPAADQRISAHVDSAIIAQNVYLFAASEGLGTCLVGGAAKDELASILGLSGSQMVTYVQPVGYPQAV